MVILFTADQYFENGTPITGFPIYLYRVTTALEELGHSPIIVACGKRNRHYIKDGVEIYFVQCTPQTTSVKSWALLKGAVYMGVRGFLLRKDTVCDETLILCENKICNTPDL